MTQRDDEPVAGGRALDAATEQLRGRTTRLPVEVVDRILAASLATPRPASLVRAEPPHEFLSVSTVALVSMLRSRLDGEMRSAAVRRVLCDTTRAERLEGVTVELVVAYGEQVDVVAEQARALVREVLDSVLGAGERAVRVVHQHVHVSDVTRDDPHLVDPFDEL